MASIKTIADIPSIDYQRIFDASPEPSLLLAPDSIILAANNAYEQVTGLKRAAIIGKHVLDIKLPGHFAGSRNAPVYDNAGNIAYTIHQLLPGHASDTEEAETGYLQDFKIAYEALDPATRKLVSSRAFLKNIINTVVDPIFVKDRQHRWIEGNNALWALIGRNEKQLIGKSDYDFFPKEEADVFWQKDEEVFNSGKVNLNIENFTDAAGKKHVISTKKACFSTPDGELVLVGVIRDITDLKEMEEKLKQRDEERLRAIMDHSGCVLYIKDLDGKYMAANKDLQALMKLPESSVLGKTDYDFFPKHYSDIFRANDLMVIKKGTSIEFEEKAPHDDGEHIYRSVKFPLYDANRKIYAICGLSTDITERRKEEEAAAFLASIITTSEDAIISENLDGIITSWNTGAEHLFGYSSQEMVGQHIGRIIPPERSGEETELLKQLQNRKAIRGFETISLTKDGRTPNISLTMSPMYNAAGQMIGVSRVARDISQQKEVQAQLLKYTWELERSNQELDDFAYIASHDLKEPLRGLFNHASFLLEDYADKLDEDAQHRLNRLSTLAQRMEYLINDLLYFSRLGRTQLAIQDSDPNAMVEEIKQMLDGVLQEYNAHITIAHPMPNLVCDKPRITEVFRNLITNAIKYNDKPERKIEVGMLPDMQTKIGPQKNVFYVKDNGIGIEKEFHEEIFRIFKRLNKPTNDKEGSTGVGLTFVKKIIERHNGHIWLESEPGAGSTFYFTVGKKTHE